MSKKSGRRNIETMSLSFLDAICCGLGAIILLLVITKLFQPVRIEQNKQDLTRNLAVREQQLTDILSDTQTVLDKRTDIKDKVETQQELVARLQSDLARIRAALLKRKDDAEVSSELAGQLALAKEHLTAEMQKLMANYKPPPDQYKIGGIPVDSQYIIFVIDNSGSMKQYQWDRLLNLMTQILDIYPQVKGMQVMNDDGHYLFASTRKEWIPDTPGRRKLILEAMRNWNAFSNSSPREGLLQAIDDFYDPNKRISIYYMGDDFSQGTDAINATVREIDRANHANDPNGRRVRIHAVAFPSFYVATGGQLLTAAAYATLMRVICGRNGGTFISLPARSAL